MSESKRQKQQRRRLLKQFLLERYPDGLPGELDDALHQKLDAEFNAWRTASWLTRAGDRENIGDVIVDRANKGLIIDGNFVPLEHLEMVISLLKEDPACKPAEARGKAAHSAQGFGGSPCRAKTAGLS
jgi:hypothetical protein